MLTKLPIVVVVISGLAFAADFDLLIRNARVVDGTGNPWFRADVGIRNGEIASIGRLAGKTADEIIEAKQRVVTSGFIDVHVHADYFPERRLTRNPDADAFLFDGVTTIVNGNCGWSEIDLADFFSSVEQAGPAVNMASMIGHGAIRRRVMGDANRAPTPVELQTMKEIVEQAMRDGAVGFSTGLWYTPASFARTEEVIALARAASSFGGVYATHVRDEGPRILEAIAEAVRIAEESGLRLQVSHLKIMDRRHWGTADKVIAALEAARLRGVDASGDFYPYEAASSRMQPLFPHWAFDGGEQSLRERLSAKESRARIAAEMANDPYFRQGQNDYSYLMVANCSFDHTLEGKSISQISRERGGKGTIEDEIQTVLDLRAKGEVILVYHTNGPQDLLTYMRWPLSAVASDTVYGGFGEGVPHPRNYGTNARVLAEFVRVRGVLTLEDAVRKMTSLPARTFGLRNRGLIREGMVADILIFDPAKVQDKATYEKPHRYSEGFDWVIVNGVPVVEEGRRRKGVRPGRILRRTM